MIKKIHFQAALKAAALHFLLSLPVAAIAATLVFGIWYPYPYSELSRGRELFLLVVGVDVVCGPLLTLVIFNPTKPRTELWRDLGIVALIQLGALGYGLSTVWEARPLFLAQEIDRFKVVAAPDLQKGAVDQLPAALKPNAFTGPITVAIRESKDDLERKTVLFESLQGGRDYAERPEFYLPYEGSAALKSLQHAKPLAVFLQKQPEQQAAARELKLKKNVDIAQLFYLPVVGRQSWVAILNKQGQIEGFLPGDGF